MKLGTDPKAPVWQAEEFVLAGARVALNPRLAIRAALVVRNGKIAAILPGNEAPLGLPRSFRVIDLKNHLILPGLVNAHDHLHFGIFPRLGNGPYPSWREWAADIHRPEEPPLQKLLAISKEARLWRGAVHNALAGVTTVCHHDSSHPALASGGFPVSAEAEFGWAHSLDDPQWAHRYASTPKTRPFILHFAEGLDAQSCREADRLERTIALNERLVLVHAVGVAASNWRRLQAAGVWIVWCPTSNLHILGRTLDRDLLLSYPSIALGSDSPLSASGDLLDELHAARALLDLPSDLLYRMVTARAARLLRLPKGKGAVAEGGEADLLIVNDHGLPPCDSLLALPRRDIAAVMRGGRFTVASDELHNMHNLAAKPHLSAFRRHGLQWHISAPPELLDLQLPDSDQRQFPRLSGNLTNQ